MELQRTYRGVPADRARIAAPRGAGRDVSPGTFRGATIEAMRKPSLTVETFVTALAFLSANTALGCSKAERATAAPEAVGAPAAAAPGAPATTPLLAAPQEAPAPGLASPSPAPAPESATVAKDEAARKKSSAPVRGAVAPPPKAAGSAKSPSAACGAGTCTPDMKKGSGN